MILNALQMPVPEISSTEPIWVILGIVIGVLLTGLFQFLTVNLKIREARKRHREDRWWNLRFDFFEEANIFFTENARFADAGKALEIAKLVDVMAGRCLFIFGSVELSDSLIEHAKNCLKLAKIRNKEDKNGTPKNKITYISDLSGGEVGKALSIMAEELGM